MAASTSRQPQDTPFPSSPAVIHKSVKQPRKGKGKEQPAGVHKRRVGQPSAWDNAQGEAVWNWTSLTDSSASQVPPIFTKDGSYFFSIVGSSVKIHSVVTGQVVSTLVAPTPPGNEAVSDLITSAILNPHNAFQLITGSLNGCIMVWDFLDAALLKTIDVAQPIHYLCAHEKFKDYVFVAATRPSKEKSDDNAAVLRVSLKTTASSANSLVQMSSDITPIGKTRSPAGLAFSPSGTWLVAVAGHKAYVASTSSFKSGFTKYVSPERLTCLAFHPSEEYFATGDEKGNIRLWYCLNDQLAVNAVGVEKKAQTTTLHWHAHAVSSIAFTPNGAYLLSGGEESVLVIWQLHTGKKEFVPRVGAPIKTVALSSVGGSEEEYLLGLADATYVFISAAALKISRSYSRIKLDPSTSIGPTTSTPLAVHRMTSTLVLPSSHPSSLQTYSPASSKLVSELEVSPSNRVSRRDDNPIEPSRVERAVISSSEDWMATIDSREGDDTFRGEIYLKIWRWDRKAGFWILNTRIDRPHGLHSVSSVSFRPSAVHDELSLQLVTTGGDGNVKTWRIRTAKDKEGHSEEFWVARSTFNFRSEIPVHASWSPDGSLLAISLGPYVALYDPTTTALRQTLTSPECQTATSTHFVGRRGRYLAVVGGSELVLWDLVAQSVRWHHKASQTIATVVCHPSQDTFALFHHPPSEDGRQRTHITIVNAASCVPVQTRTVPFGILNVAWYPIASASSSFTLVGITQTWSVVLFGDEVQVPEDEGSTAREIFEGSSQKRTLFQDIFGKSAFTELANGLSASFKTSAGVTSRTGKDVASIFDGPAYLMPPLDSLYSSLIDSFIKIRVDDEVIPASSDAPELEDEDVDMEEESSDPIVVGKQRRRVVSDEEMKLFVDLFKQQSVNSKPHTPLFASNGKTNGHGKSVANGNGHTSSAASTPKQNGSHQRSKVAIPNPPIASAVSPLSLPVATASPLTNGNAKKRKKSIS